VVWLFRGSEQEERDGHWLCISDSLFITAYEYMQCRSLAENNVVIAATGPRAYIGVSITSDKQQQLRSSRLLIATAEWPKPACSVV
jgi:hypothetical protein